MIVITISNVRSRNWKRRRAGDDWDGSIRAISCSYTFRQGPPQRDESKIARCGPKQRHSSIAKKPMPYSESLAERVRQVFDRRGGVTQKNMFGGVGFLLHG